MKFITIALVVVLAVSSFVEGLRIHTTRKADNIKTTIPKPKTFYFEQNLDHFTFNDDRTFKQRYLVNGNTLVVLYFNYLISLKTDDSFDPNNGPIFFYAGNEGDIENFWYNTGFMFDLAPIFRALIIFPEHVIQLITYSFKVF